MNEVHDTAVFMELQFKFLPIGSMHLKLIQNSMDFNLTTTIASTATQQTNYTDKYFQLAMLIVTTLLEITQKTGDYWSKDYCRLLEITGDIYATDALLFLYIFIYLFVLHQWRGRGHGMTSSNAAYNSSSGVDHLVS